MKSKAHTRDLYLRRKYGITLKDYNRMLVNQYGQCAICKKDSSNFKNALHVDHNHKTGRVRALLCYYCNRRLVGRHTLKTAKLLYDYLRRYDRED